MEDGCSIAELIPACETGCWPHRHSLFWERRELTVHLPSAGQRRFDTPIMMASTTRFSQTKGAGGIHEEDLRSQPRLCGHQDGGKSRDAHRGSGWLGRNARSYGASPLKYHRSGAGY